MRNLHNRLQNPPKRTFTCASAHHNRWGKVPQFDKITTMYRYRPGTMSRHTQLGNRMVNYLHKQLRSERGASISFALFLALVCAAVASIVLAAATASSGAFAKVGAYDTSYYSVTSAVGMFRDVLDSDGKVVYRARVKKESPKKDSNARDNGEITSSGNTKFESITRLSVVMVAGADSEVRPSDQENPSNGMDFPYLEDVTSYLLFGEKLTENDDVNEDWAFSDGYKDFQYLVTPDDDKASVVTVKARLYENGLLELVFTDEGNSSMFMSLQGIREDRDVTSSELGDTQVGSEVSNTFQQTVTHETIVSWRLVQLTPGKGFMNGEADFS